MKKIVGLFFIACQFFSIKGASLPAENLLTIKNLTGHAVYIVENSCYKKIGPTEEVTLFWKEPLTNGDPAKVKIYYGASSLNEKYKKKKRTSRPPLIAKIKTNTPGTIALKYDQAGMLSFDRES